MGARPRGRRRVGVSRRALRGGAGRSMPLAVPPTTGSLVGGARRVKARPARATGGVAGHDVAGRSFRTERGLPPPQHLDSCARRVATPRARVGARWRLHLGNRGKRPVPGAPPRGRWRRRGRERELPAGRARVPRSSGARLRSGVRRTRGGQLGTPRPDRSAAVGARSHRVLRRRPVERHLVRGVCRCHVHLRAPRGATGARPVQSSGHSERASVRSQRRAGGGRGRLLRAGTRDARGLAGSLGRRAGSRARVGARFPVGPCAASG
jgi:hypothetical protein